MRTAGHSSPASLVPRPVAVLLIVAAAAAIALLGVIRPAHANGEGTFAFETNTYVVEEGDVVTLTVVRTGGSGAIDIDYLVDAMDAPVGVPGGTVSFGAGDNEATIAIATGQDPDDVNDDFTVTLVDPPGDATLGSPAMATVTVADDDGDPTFTFLVDNFSVVEGEPVTVTVIRSGGTGSAAEVDVIVDQDTAIAETNYDLPDGHTEPLAFAEGVTQASFEIDTIDDGVDTADLAFDLSLDSDDEDAVTSDTATVTIIDIENGVLAFDAATYTVAEDGTSIAITVTRSGGTTGDVTVTCATVAGGTATVAADYTAVDQLLEFDDGDTEATCTVAIADDDLLEGDETVFLALGDPAGGAILGGQSTATLTIEDDELAPVIAFSAATYSVVEGDLVATITVERSGDTTGESTVTWVAGEGGDPPAVDGVDFEGDTGELVFEQGVTSLTFDVTILDDDVIEEDEIVALALLDPEGAVLGDNDTALLTILDDDTPAATLTYTLYFRWSLYAWLGEDGADILDLLANPGEGSAENLDEMVTAIWYWDSAAQAWSSWFLLAEVDNIPGLNDFETLTYGHAYWIAVNTEGAHDWVVPEGP